ncbi:cysteine desulfurase activator complex subunit SufD [Escherichia coli]|uniref:Cysteine desulfurase activator complex subunit SufD n=1 Tax=Escherichia coli TaxID=562 RepID=A0A377BCC9_ECOLX|nr:cysteine desulfurase activator complex subunit SufD [Escherichia coli]
MTNNNLLMGKLAEVDTKPQLEIYADDVKCQPRRDGGAY